MTLNGIAASDLLSDPTAAWPMKEVLLNKADLTYADGVAYEAGMGQPGIHGLFTSTPPYYLSTTALSMESPGPISYGS